MKKVKTDSVPAKKKKIILTVCLSVLAAVILTGALFIFLPTVSLDYGNSSIHSRSDIAGAFSAVKAHFAKNMFGSRILSAEYSGDRKSETELAWAQRNSESGKTYADFIVFDVSFRASVFQHDFFTPGQEVKWSYMVAKTSDGVWKVVNHGVA